MIIEQILQEAQNYEAMFNDILKLNADPRLRHQITQDIDWARKALRKNDRIVWFLRWVKIWLISTATGSGVAAAAFPGASQPQNRRLGTAPGQDDLMGSPAMKQQLEHFLTTRQLLYLCDRRQAGARNRQRIVGGQVSDLIEFAQAGNRMGTILIDPPWPTVNAVLPYLSITPDELQNLPIPDLAADRCHLHVWATANNFLFDAKDVIEGWGFRVVGNFVWAKPQLGRGNYWRQSHEIMLTAVRGDADRFDDLGLRSWIAAPRGRHSEKPDAIRDMIERASPGPRLEIFARSQVPNWYSWGHEIAEPLTEQAARLDRTRQRRSVFHETAARTEALRDHQGHDCRAADRLRLLAGTCGWRRGLLRPPACR
jgi:N6-adenosine-specific RNA methylase IME4